MSDLRYCLYARKSSEQEEKQSMSLESQLKEMRKIQEIENLNVVKVIEESKSAKKSFSRLGFIDLMKGLVEEEYNAILTWSVDRLSRNAGDLGVLVDLMDQDKLKIVRTHDRTFEGEKPSEKFLLMLLCSQAKLENEHRGENVKRGMRAMREQGRKAGTTPVGYKMIPGETVTDHNKVVVDEEWTPFIKDIFNMVGKRDMSVYQIWRKLHRAGVVTKKGKPFSKSSLIRMLLDTFYYGEFESPKGSGKWYKGIHKPIITKDLYEKVQKNMAKRRPRQPKRKWGKIPFKFNRIFKCGECGSGISGEIHRNRSNRLYLYYKCNKSCSFGDCTQERIRGNALLDQLESISKTITVSDIGSLNERQTEDRDRCNRFFKPPIEPYEFIQEDLISGGTQEKADALRALKGKLIIKDKTIQYLPL